MAEATEKTKKMPLNPLDKSNQAQSSGDSELIKGIVSTESGEGEKQILEQAPTLDQSLLDEELEKKSSGTVGLLLLKIFFGLTVGAGFAMYLFFTSQLSDKLEYLTQKLNLPSVYKELSGSNQELLALKTDLNFYNYMQAKAYLDEFSYYSDDYLQNYEILSSKTADEDQKEQSAAHLEELREDMAESFALAKEHLVKPVYVDLVKISDEPETSLQTMFQNQLSALIRNKANALANSEEPEAQGEYKNYQQALSLVGNSSLKNLMVNTDFENLSDQELYELIKNMSQSLVTDFSIIQKIKNERIKWSQVMDEIEKNTMIVDKYYSQDYYDEYGGIRYTSYSFDTDNKRISISGETKRFDTTNFTTISNLIDQLNESEMFEGAQMQSFSKSGSLDQGYKATLNLDLTLENGEK